MVRPKDIADLAHRRVGRILDVAEAAIPPERFAAFRRIVLREFGSDGFAQDVERLLAAPAGPRNGRGEGGA